MFLLHTVTQPLPDANYLHLRMHSTSVRCMCFCPSKHCNPSHFTRFQLRFVYPHVDSKLNAFFFTFCSPSTSQAPMSTTFSSIDTRAIDTQPGAMDRRRFNHIPEAAWHTAPPLIPFQPDRLTRSPRPHSMHSRPAPSTRSVVDIWSLGNSLLYSHCQRGERSRWFDT